MACVISGEFCSDSWRDTIKKLQDEATEHVYMQGGCDDDTLYTGEINTIRDFKLVQLHNSSTETIRTRLYNELDDVARGYGVIIEGGLVGYGVYTPSFVDARISIGGIKFNGNSNVLCKEVVRGNRVNIVDTGHYGTQAELKEMVKKVLTDNKHLEDVYYIISRTGKAIKCYNNQSAKRDTQLRTMPGSAVVKPMYKYFWAGIALD